MKEYDVQDVLNEISKVAVDHLFIGAKNVTEYPLVAEKKNIECNLDTNIDKYEVKRKDINNLVVAVCINGDAEFLQNLSSFSMIFSFCKTVMLHVENPWRLLHPELATYLKDKCLDKQLLAFIDTLDTSKTIIMPLINYTRENFPDAYRTEDITFKFTFKDKISVKSKFSIDIIQLKYKTFSFDEVLNGYIAP